MGSETKFTKEEELLYEEFIDILEENEFIY